VQLIFWLELGVKLCGLLVLKLRFRSCIVSNSEDMELVGIVFYCCAIEKLKLIMTQRHDFFTAIDLNYCCSPSGS